MQFYDLLRTFIEYIPERFSFISDFFGGVLPYVLMGCALFTAFFGLKCAALWCSVTFFFLGSSLAAQYIITTVNLKDFEFWFALGICLSAGVICAVFSKYLYRLQLLVSLFFLVLAGMPPFISHASDLFARIVSAIIALALAFLSVKYKYIIVIITTSFSGSFIFFNVLSQMVDVPYEFAISSLLGVAALAFQVIFNREQLKETYKDVKMKVTKTKHGGEKAYGKIKEEIERHEQKKHPSEETETDETGDELISLEEVHNSAEEE